LESLHNFKKNSWKCDNVFGNFPQKVPLTMLLGTFLKSQNGEFLPPKKIKNH
jgi:hypothetical protein